MDAWDAIFTVLEPACKSLCLSTAGRYNIQNFPMKKILFVCFLWASLFLSFPGQVLAQGSDVTSAALDNVLKSNELGPWSVTNAFDYAIRGAVASGVPSNTIVLLLLLPLVAAIIAAARHLVGIRGFGIFLPAALSVVFLAIGPIVGLILFLIIVTTSAVIRSGLKVIKLRLQYLPRMALLLWFVVLVVLMLIFVAPVTGQPALSSISIFPVLILVLLAEDFTKVQMGKSAKTAINLTTETLILALLSYIFLTFRPLQEFAILNPEIWLAGILIFDIVVGKYAGLRFMEFYRFRKLLKN